MEATATFSVGAPTIVANVPPVAQFQEIVGQIGARSHEPGHQLRWSENTVYPRLAETLSFFYVHLSMIGSVLELNQWKVAMNELIQTLDHYIEFTLSPEGGFVHMNCGKMLLIVDATQTELTALCKQMAKWNHRISAIEVPLGWRYATIDTLTDWYVCIALPSSLVESLASSQTTLIPTPLGQLNALYTVEGALRKMAHWYRQQRFSDVQHGEIVKLLCFRPRRTMITCELKQLNGYGGFRRYNNCSFIGSSWCLTIDSDYENDSGCRYCLPGDCRETAIILELTGLTVEKTSGLIHNSAYANWMPTEGVHRHCSYPLSAMQLEGVPQLSLLDDDCLEMPATDIGQSSEGIGSPGASGSLADTASTVFSCPLRRPLPRSEREEIDDNRPKSSLLTVHLSKTFIVYFSFLRLSTSQHWLTLWIDFDFSSGIALPVGNSLSGLDNSSTGSGLLKDC
ncbi:unnamed protein product [Symbiodinium sp. CCMP2456]|nr:unnamed protein product [Symbiodinium sp. CCMP2456]